MSKDQKIFELKMELHKTRDAFYKASGEYTGAMKIYELINYQNKSLFNQADTVLSKLWDNYERLLNKMKALQDELEELTKYGK